MKTILTFLVWILAVVTACAQPALGSNAEQMNVLRNKIDKAYVTYYATNDESGKLYDSLSELQKTVVPQMFLLAQKEPDSQAACDVFLWIAMKSWANRGPLLTNRLQSLDYLAQYHSTNSKVGPLCSYLGRWRWDERPAINFLEAVEKNNSNRAIRAQAIFGLAELSAVKSEVLAEYENWGNSSLFTNDWSADSITKLRIAGTSQAAAAEAEHRYEDILTNYADCLDLRERRNPKEEAPTLKKLAEENLFELLHLSLGQTAPEIEEGGIDGKKFKLSDSRSKVTMLNFWASWCGPCMQMVPVERALAERLQGKSFAIIGVNGDPNLKDANRAMQRENMTWPSFWNGKGGPEGPISSAWNVHGWPTVYLLDANGVIRFKYEGYGLQTSNVLNGSVDELMKQLESGKN